MLPRAGGTGPWARECGMDVDAVALGEEPANANFIAYDADETGVPYAGAITV